MKKNVLIVEDENTLASAIAAKLEISGFDVAKARSVEQAISYLEEIPKIDVIWLDHYLLGSENGLDFVHSVKNSEKWKGIPIFVVSNTATPDKIKSYMQLGVEKYYVKAEHRLEDIIKDIKKVA